MIATSWISIPNGAGSHTDAYLALPPGAGDKKAGPALLLFQEIFGVNRHIRAVADQYAAAGYVVLVPDLFWAQGKRVELGYTGTDRERAVALMNGCNQDALIADIKAYAAALRARPEASSPAYGAVGYCMGGRMAYFAAAHAGAAAASCYYGGGIQNNLNIAPQVRSPIQFHYGEHDTMIPPEAVEAVRTAIPAAQIYTYPADHGFNCWDRATFDANAARVALARTLGFLAENLS
jgi:carboxymethylenebutenolidase